MIRRVTKGFQVFASVATIGIGVSLALKWREDPVAEVAALATIGLGLLQAFLAVFLETFTTGGGGQKEASLDRVVEHVIGSVRRLLAMQRDYNDNLSDLNMGLSQLPSRNEVQDIVVKLMNRNMEMQARVNDLSRNLEDSQQQIINLRNNVNEVGKIAMTDALTELGNRRFFDQTLATETARAKATGAALSLAIADLDRFKSVNDRFGHAVGDQLLRLFADLLALHAKDSAFAARYGGEEFALVFPGASVEKATSTVERIRRELESKRWVVGEKNERLGVITASFGIAELGAHETARSLIERADTLLFEAKQQGRNRVVSQADGRGAAALAG